MNRTRRLLLCASALALSACAGLSLRQPLVVSLVGLDPMPGQGMEGRFLARLRVQNPNENAVDFDGISLELDVRGSRLATGVSDAKGSIPRFGESVVAVPVTVPVSALVRQAIGLATGDLSRVDYRIRGRLGGSLLGGASFEARGEFTLPAGLGAGPGR